MNERLSSYPPKNILRPIKAEILLVVHANGLFSYFYYRNYSIAVIFHRHVSSAAGGNSEEQ